MLTTFTTQLQFLGCLFIHASRACPGVYQGKTLTQLEQVGARLNLTALSCTRFDAPVVGKPLPVISSPSKKRIFIVLLRCFFRIEE
jgi:hypothetical protein